MPHLAENSSCSGCQACAEICPQKCIDMQTDSEGFLYPIIDEVRCIGCDKCEEICPVLNPYSDEDIKTPVAFAAYNKDTNIREQSSSGGIFTLLAEKVLEHGGIVFGACMDRKMNVVHDYAVSTEDLAKFRGSKYVQSNVGSTYQQVKVFLKEGKFVLYTGTPCQIGGLKAYLNKKYENLICQDIICHGVSSPNVWRYYLKARETETKSKVCSVNFRDKAFGWRKFTLSLLFSDGTLFRKRRARDSMMVAFLRNICLRPSCHNCSYKTVHRQSDITLADFWGFQDFVPSWNDDQGISLIWYNSRKGGQLVNQVLNRAVITEIDLYKYLDKYNKSAFKSSKPNKNRERFFNELGHTDFDKLVKKYCRHSYAVKIKKAVHLLYHRFNTR